MEPVFEKKIVKLGAFVLPMVVAIATVPANAQPRAIGNRVVFAQYVAQSIPRPTMQPAETGFASVTGTVTYRQGITIPPEALLVVRLEDVTVKNAPVTLATQTFRNPGQGSTPFELTYDRAQINPNHTYAIQALIFVDNQVRFLNTSNYPVITQGNPSNVQVILGPVGENQTTPRTSARVTGTVTYRQRIALPPNAVVEVKLLDVSRQDAPAVTIAQQNITVGNRQVPIPFTLTYNPARINPRHTYTIQARILINGRPRFRNTSAYRVITQGRPNTVEVVVNPVN
jgi:uncharacterized lipoprotein YbaY